MYSLNEDKVKIFIGKYWNFKLDKLKLETTLDDIGMFGDDKYEFIIDFTKEFNLSIKQFPFDKYIDDEGGYFIRKFLFGKKLRKIQPITLLMLVNWVDKGYWEEL
ncbi:Protein of unknown function (DUF1493) [Apibacter mensalis]|jgi:hypothetical protein|uniref:DUF1493 family protein n=1 Tax=Apibacter mensalis TaxID=1586267 RepID=A0A0X3APL0_9FLAO|nr:DUF1493 family protein [Apibacter mensalis]CVK16173.1 Protein of unknown function (DUF1493) [Apibacter mensalis]